jgi:hypothetical protein
MAALVRLAKSYLGTPYVWGGESPGGFDCSGFTQWLYGQFGISLPRVTYEQVKVGRAVGRGELRPGDLVFFRQGSRGPEHMGMYIGGGKFIQAPRTGDVVKISNMSDRTDFVTARRVVDMQPGRLEAALLEGDLDVAATDSGQFDTAKLAEPLEWTFEEIDGMSGFANRPAPLTPRKRAETWKLLSTLPAASPETVRFARLAGGEFAAPEG